MANVKTPPAATAPAAEVKWLTEDQVENWILLTALLSKLPSALDAQLQESAGLSFFEYSVLAGLSASPNGTLRMSTLATFANGSLSRLSHVMSRLEKRGFVKRRPCKDDGRATEAVLTAAGRRAITAAAPAHVIEARRLVVDALTSTQFTQLGLIARRILTAIDGHEFETPHKTGE
jgi:DNA-binding MarR family transcriptional regulator